MRTVGYDGHAPSSRAGWTLKGRSPNDWFSPIPGEMDMAYTQFLEAEVFVKTSPLSSVRRATQLPG
jgi:hypothetical protein